MQESPNGQIDSIREIHHISHSKDAGENRNWWGRNWWTSATGALTQTVDEPRKMKNHGDLKCGEIVQAIKLTMDFCKFF